MNQAVPISISQQPDVFGFVSGEIGQGSTLGAIYHQLPSAEHAIDDLTTALARHVLETHPTADIPVPRDRWLQAAHALIKAKRLPLPAGYSTETNVDKLIRWVDQKCERVVIGILPELDRAGVRHAYIVAEWMTRVSRLPTAIVYGVTGTVRQNPSAFRSSLERKLARRLEQDSELSGLFEPNILLLTVFHTRPRVDFIWRPGRLIVEIDSYRYHATPDGFTGDRQRDYETLVSGYVTLRVTDQELNQDLDLVMEKIRHCVRIRKNLFHV